MTKTKGQTNIFKDYYTNYTASYAIHPIKGLLCPKCNQGTYRYKVNCSTRGDLNIYDNLCNECRKEVGDE